MTTAQSNHILYVTDANGKEVPQSVYQHINDFPADWRVEYREQRPFVLQRQTPDGASVTLQVWAHNQDDANHKFAETIAYLQTI